MTSFIKTADHLTIVFDHGDVVTVYPSNENYPKIVQAVSAKDWETARRLSSPSRIIEEKLETSKVADRVKIAHGVVSLDDEPIHNSLTDRMLSMIEEGFDVGPMALFLQNLMDNPSFRAVNELYTFLEKSDLPITDDGCFLAYKRIKSNWTDEHSGKIDNKIGAVVEMKRNAVNEDSSQTCSDGLHFCSRSYLPHYGSGSGGRVVIVKINPADVVAIPKDYNDAKGRCCKYTVINEIRLDGKQHSSMPKATLEKTRVVDTTVKTTKASTGGKRVIQQLSDNGTVIATFDTPGHAERITGINSSSISKVARKLRKTAGGYGWRFEMVADDLPKNNWDDLAEADGDDDYEDDGDWFNTYG